MGIVNNGSIYTSPSTAAHLRSVLATIQSTSTSVAGDIATIQARLDAIESFAGLRVATFDAATAEGQVVYVKSTGNTGLSEADNTTNAKAIGLTFDTVAAAGTGFYLTHGHLEVADWTNVIGTTNLTPGAIYFLSATAGQMTTTPPTTGTIVRLGIALTTTVFNISIQPGIFLS